MGRNSVYESVTERIVAEIEAGGTAPWVKPWKSRGGYPISLSTGKVYRGVNVLLLGLSSFDDPRWGTFRACREAAVAAAKKEGRDIITEESKRGTQYWEMINGEKKWFRGGVKKGEKSVEIVLHKQTPKKKEQGSDDDPGNYWLMRFYNVFNALQCEGIPDLPKEVEREFTPIEQAKRIVNGYVWSEDVTLNETTGPRVEYGFDRAYYNLTQDIVGMPKPEQFFSDESFYTTLFHELTHSTGAEKRLGRIEPALFGTDPYAKEELVAEIGASFLAGFAEFEDAGGDQSAAYVKNWLGPLKNDPKLVVSAAGQAQRAVDLILGTTFDDSGIPEQEAVAA